MGQKAPSTIRCIKTLGGVPGGRGDFSESESTEHHKVH